MSRDGLSDAAPAITAGCTHSCAFQRRCCAARQRWEAPSAPTSHCCVKPRSQPLGSHEGRISCSCLHLRGAKGWGQGSDASRTSARQLSTEESHLRLDWLQHCDNRQLRRCAGREAPPRKQRAGAARGARARAPVLELALRHRARHAQAALQVEDRHNVGVRLAHNQVIDAEHLAAEGRRFGTFTVS